MHEALNRPVLSCDFVANSVDLVLMLDIAHMNRNVANQLANLFTPLLAADDVNDLAPASVSTWPTRSDTLSVRHAEDHDATVGQVEEIIDHC